MKYTLKKAVKKPFIHSKNNIITKVNDEFVYLTGYSKEQIIGQSLAEISCKLSMDSQISIENIEERYSCYIFTKEYEPKEVTIFCKSLEFENERIYLLKEKPNSRVRDKFTGTEQLYKNNNNTGIVILSLPDLIVLSANDNYLKLLDAPYNKRENAIGRNQKEIINGFKKNDEEENYLNSISLGKAYHGKEIKREHFKRGTTYWDIDFVPIHIEGKPKYIVKTITDVTEKVFNREFIKEQAEVIEQKNRQLEAVIESMSDAIFISNNKGEFININAAGRELLNQSNPLNLVGELLKTTEFFDMSSNKFTVENMPLKRVLNGEKVKNELMVAKRPDQQVIVRCNSNPVYDIHGNVTMAVACYHNITDLYTKEKIIKEQKEELEAVIENISDGFIIFDKDGKNLRLNKAAREILLLESNNVNNVEDFDREFEAFDMNKNLINQEDRPCHRVMRGETLLEYRIVSKVKDKISYLDVNGTPIYDNEGNRIKGVLCFRDVTEKMQYEEAMLLKNQYDLLNSMIEHLDLPVLRLTYPDFKVKEVNQKAFNFAKGLNPKLKKISSIKGQNYTDVLIGMNIVTCSKCIKSAIEKGKTICSGFKRFLVTGKEMFTKMFCQPVYGLNGEVTEVVVIMIDITKEINAKHKVEEDLKIQEEFLANVAHELKTPLNVIFSTAQLFELFLKNDSIEENKAKIINNISVIRQNCYRLTKLISNIVDLSKIKSGLFEMNESNENIVSITEDIVQSVSQFVHSKGLRIIFDTNTEEKIIACDPDKIERIILNLISNAIKFSNIGEEIIVSVIDEGDTVEISVVDKGIGIDDKHLSTIFERFNQVDKSFTRNAEGTGIGLNLVKSIVELHGGKIFVESKLGEGSTFKIKLPSRTIKESKNINKSNDQNNKIEMINIEFSDIYSI